MEELGDKVPASEKSDVENKCNDLKEALKGTDTALIKQKSEDLQKALYDLSSKLYQQAGAAQGNPDMGGAATGEADNSIRDGYTAFVPHVVFLVKFRNCRF